MSADGQETLQKQVYMNKFRLEGFISNLILKFESKEI